MARRDARVWHKHQTVGELDDDRLVDALAGDANVYRRRAYDEDADDDDGEGDVNDQAGDEQDDEERKNAGDDDWLKRPRSGPRRPRLRVKVCVDLGSSTYAKDGKDGRLARLLKVVVTLLEAFDGIPPSLGVEWALSAFSGAGPELALKKWKDRKLDAPHGSGSPRLPEPRLNLVRRMASHAQYCRDGDATLSAAAAALRKIRNVAADAYLVVLCLCLDDFAAHDDDFRARALAEVLESENHANVERVALLVADGNGVKGSAAALAANRFPPGAAVVATSDADLGPALERVLRDKVEG